MTHVLSQIWSFYTKGNVDVTLSEDLFIHIMQTQVSDPAFAEALVEISDINFSIVDANADGSIDLNELAVIFDSYGIDKRAAQVAFEAMDADNDGLISMNEFRTSLIAFFTGEDEEHPSK